MEPTLDKSNIWVYSDIKSRERMNYKWMIELV